MKTISVYLGTGPGRLLLIIGNYQQLAEGWLSVNFCLHFVFPNRETVKRDKNILGHMDTETMDRLGHMHTKTVDILGHMHTETMDRLGHTDTETVDILGHTDTKNVDILGHTDTETVDVFFGQNQTNCNY